MFFNFDLLNFLWSFHLASGHDPKKHFQCKIILAHWNKHCDWLITKMAQPIRMLKMSEA